MGLLLQWLYFRNTHCKKWPKQDASCLHYTLK